MSCSWYHFCEHTPMWIGTKETSQMSCLWTLLYLLQNRISTRHLIFHLRDIGLKPIEMNPNLKSINHNSLKLSFVYKTVLTYRDKKMFYWWRKTFETEGWEFTKSFSIVKVDFVFPMEAIKVWNFSLATKWSCYPFLLTSFEVAFKLFYYIFQFLHFSS